MPNTEKTNVNRISYWHGYCHNPDIDLTPHDILKIHRLLQGALVPVGYEKLNSAGDLHSIRCSAERRLILKTIAVPAEGDDKPKQYLKVVGIAATHNYDAIIRSHLSSHKVNEPLTFIHAEDIEAIEIDNGENITVIPHDQHIELTRYHHHLVVLNEDQAAAKQLSLPAIITGPAGSGKTLSMLALLNNLIEDITENNIVLDKPIAVVTPKPKLNKLLHDLWYCETNPLSTTPAGSQVVFLSEADIYSHHAPVQHQGFTEIDAETFIKTIRSTLTKTAKNKAKKCASLDNVSLLHEFEIMANTGSKAVYLNLGERESYLSSDALRAERSFLYDCYEHVVENLRKQRQYSPYIYTWKPEPIFHAVLHDEAQTGYLNIKFMLRQMTEQARYLLCAHSAQTTEKQLTDIPRFIQHLGVANQPLPVHSLTISYRNPLLVLLFSDYINRLKRYIAGGAPDKTDKSNTITAQHNAKNRGSIEWLPTTALAEHLALQPANHIQTVIITRKEFINEAIQIFNTGHVVTAAQFGGQECDNVYLYKMTHCQDSESVNTPLEHFNDAVRDNVNLPKAGQSNFTFNPFFAELYTAITRAKKSVIMVEDENPNLIHKRRHLIHLIKSKMAALNCEYPRLAAERSPDATQPVSVNEAHWLAKIEEYLENNEIEVAKQLWEINLKRSPDAFNQTYFKTTPTPPKPQASAKIAPAPKQNNTARKNTAPTKPIEILDYQNLPLIYAQLDTNPTFIKTLCREINGITPLNEIFVKDPEQFGRYFSVNPQPLLLLTTQQWLKKSGKMPYPLLLMVILILCGDAIPKFMSQVVFPANNYQLLAEIPFDEMFLKNHQIRLDTKTFASMAECLMNCNRKSGTSTHITLLEYYLIKHKKELFKIDTLFLLCLIKFDKPEHAKLVKVLDFDMKTCMPKLIEETFLKTNYFTAFTAELKFGLKQYEYLLTNTLLVTALMQYISNQVNFVTTQQNHDLAIRRLHDAMKKVDFTRVITINDITAPFIFHLIDNEWSRMFMAHMLSIFDARLITRTRSQNALLVTQLLTPYPSRTLMVDNTPTNANCLQILKVNTIQLSDVCTIMHLFDFGDLLEQLLAIDPHFFFEDTAHPESVNNSLLFRLYCSYIPKKNISALDLMLSLNNGLLFQYMPTDLILRLASNTPRRTFGHLLIQNHHFDFIKHYYAQVADKITAIQFAEMLYAFLFETQMLTHAGYITTFTALRDLPHHRTMLSNALAFINAYLPVLRELNTTLPTEAPIADLGEYDPMNLAVLFQPISATTLSKIIKDIESGNIDPILKRRDLLTLLFCTHPTTNKTPTLLIKTLMADQKNLTRLFTLLSKRPALLRHVFDELRPMNHSRQAPQLTYFEIFISDPDLSRLLELFISNSPVYFFETKQYITYDFLLSNTPNSLMTHLFALAKYSPIMLGVVTAKMPYVLSDFPLSLWFPFDDDKTNVSIMTEVISQHAATQLIFSSILSLQDSLLLKRLSFSELTKQMIEVQRNLLLSGKRYSIIEFAIALLKEPVHKDFHQFVYILLLNHYGASKFVKFLTQPNFANNLFMAQPQLFYFCYHRHFAENFKILLPSLTINDVESIVKCLGFTSAYIKDKTNRTVWSALSVLILENGAAGIPLLSDLFRKYPYFIDSIPLTAWSSPENPANFVLLNRLRHNTVEPELYDFMLQHSKKVSEAHLSLLNDDVTHMLLTEPQQTPANFQGRFFNQRELEPTNSLYDAFTFERTNQQP